MAPRAEACGHLGRSRLMGSAYSYDTKNGKRRKARYRKPDGKTTRKGFIRKRDAEASTTSVESAKLQGSYIAPSESRSASVNSEPLG